MASYLITDTIVFTGEEVLESASVLVEDGVVVYVGNQPPATDHPTISRPNHTLLPGLIDAHVHIIHGKTEALHQSLQFGLTTVLEMGNSYSYIESLREAAQKSDMADYKTACGPATIPGGYPEPMLRAHDPNAGQDIATWIQLRSTDDVDAFMKKSIEYRADYIKVLQESGFSMGMDGLPAPSQELQTAVVEAAHKQGLKVVGHALSLEDTMVLLRAGVDGTAHVFFDKTPTEELIAAHRNAWCCPTLVTISSITGRRPEVDPRIKLSEEAHNILCMCIDAKGPGCTLENAFETVRRLKAAGVDIVCGTDAAAVTLGTAYGASLHQELWMYVENCGFTPVEALRSATTVTARCFGLADRGLIEKGKRADLLLVEGDVTKDIRQSLNVRSVWKAGVMTTVE